MMGTFDKTSTWYILSSPEFTCTAVSHSSSITYPQMHLKATCRKGLLA